MNNGRRGRCLSFAGVGAAEITLRGSERGGAVRGKDLRHDWLCAGISRADKQGGWLGGEEMEQIGRRLGASKPSEAAGKPWKLESRKLDALINVRAA